MYEQLSTLNQEQMNIIIALGFKTGSQVLGGATEDSDHDYVMLQSDYDANFNFPYSPYEDIFGTASVKQWFEDKCVNILIAEDQLSYQSWVFATGMYQKTVSPQRKLTKQLRVKLFSSFRELYLQIKG